MEATKTKKAARRVSFKNANYPDSLNEILFPVEMRENPRKSNPEYSRIVTGKINGEEVDLNYCSDRYELVPNAQIFPVVRNLLLTHGLKFSEKYSHAHHARFYAEIILEDDKFAYHVQGRSDVVKPMLKIQHSYNGLTKYMITFGYFRLVCSNGLVVPVEEMKKYNLAVTGKHTASIRQSLSQLNVSLTYFVENADQITLAITAGYEALASKAVKNPADRVKEVLEANKIRIVENNKFSTMNYIMDRINQEKPIYDNKVNDWLVYNAINSYLFSDRTIEAPEMRRQKDQKVFNTLLAV